MSCMNNCNNHGDCTDGSCSCDVGWFSSFCAQSLLSEFERGFTFWQYTFTILYFIMGFYTFVTVYHSIKDYQTISYLKGFRLIFNCSRSPKFLSLIIILIICVLRIVWFTFDPFLLRNMWHRSIERVLYEVVFSFLYMLFSIILFVWYIIFGELADNVTHDRSKNPNNSETLKFRIVIIFTIQMYSSITKGERLGTNVLISNNVIYLVAYAFLFFFILEFSFQGGEIYKILKVIEKRNLENFAFKKEKNKEEIDIVMESSNLRIPQLPSDPPINTNTENNGQNTMENQLLFNNQEMETSKILSPIARKRKSSNKRDLPSLRKSSLSPKKTDRRNKRFESGIERPNHSHFNSPEKIKSPNGGVDVKASEILLQSKKNNFASRIMNLIPKKMNKSTSSMEDFMKPPAQIDPRNAASTYVEEIEKKLQKEKEALQNFGVFTYSKDHSFIMENPEDANCWQISHFDRKLLNIKEKENFESVLSKDLSKPSQKRIDYKKFANIQTFDGTGKKSMYNNDDYDQKNFEFHMKKTTIIQDRRVSRRILTITLMGLGVEICFAILSLLQYYSTSVNNPESLLSLLYATSILEYFSCVLVVFLFTHEKSKEINNLRWISKVGNTNNRINKMFIFKMPSFLLQESPNYVELQNRLNFLSRNEPGWKNSNR